MKAMGTKQDREATELRKTLRARLPLRYRLKRIVVEFIDDRCTQAVATVGDKTFTAYRWDPGSSPIEASCWVPTPC